jgi:hypothetical protein
MVELLFVGRVSTQVGMKDGGTKILPYNKNQN